MTKSVLFVHIRPSLVLDICYGPQKNTYFSFPMIFIKKYGTQLLIHLLFWLFFTAVSLFVFTPYYWTENPFLQYFFILVSIVYSNYFVLLPFFVKRKWYFLYLLLFAAIAFLATQLYCNVFTRCGCTVLKCLSDYLWQTLVPLLFFSFVWLLFRFIENTEEIEEVKKAHTAMELQFLKNQINPHVLFNNLNTIYAHAIEKPDETPDLILKLSENLQHVLYESHERYVSLSKEIDYIDNYLAFQELRTEGLQTIHYEKNIVPNRLKIAPLLLITIIENAFKHSIPHGSIRLRLVVKEQQLDFFCENSYRPKNEENERTIGLKNLRKRLDLIYKEHYRLEIRQETLFKVHLSIKLTEV